MRRPRLGVLWASAKPFMYLMILIIANQINSSVTVGVELIKAHLTGIFFFFQKEVFW
jgi:hypothetical protein